MRISDWSSDVCSSDLGGQKCKLRCPKCNGQDLLLAEIWEGSGIYFEVCKGVMPGEAIDHFQGAPVRVAATCKACKHEWIARGITNVFDLAIESENTDDT